MIFGHRKMPGSFEPYIPIEGSDIDSGWYPPPVGGGARHGQAIHRLSLAACGREQDRLSCHTDVYNVDTWTA